MPQIVHPRLRALTREIHIAPRQATQAMVVATVEVMHLHPLLDHLDKGQEQLPVQTIFIQLVRMTVRCGDNDGAPREQLFKQASDQHRIGNIGDLHFIETQQRRALGNRLGHRFNGVLTARLAGLTDAVVNILHKGMEMHAPLGRHRRAFEKQIHQHGFAPPDTAVHIQTGDVRLAHPLTAPSEYAQPHLAPRARLIADQTAVQQLQLLHRQALRRVRL